MSRYAELTEEQKERRRQSVRDYRARNAGNEDHRRRKWDYDRKALYGVTLDEMATHLAEQGGGCKICEAPLSMDTLGSRKRAGKPHVDHCHTTGAFRGILCHGCNIALGLFRDNPKALNNAIKYLNEGATQ